MRKAKIRQYLKPLLLLGLKLLDYSRQVFAEFSTWFVFVSLKVLVTASAARVVDTFLGEDHANEKKDEDGSHEHFKGFFWSGVMPLGISRNNWIDLVNALRALYMPHSQKAGFSKPVMHFVLCVLLIYLFVNYTFWTFCTLYFEHLRCIGCLEIERFSSLLRGRWKVF